MAEQLSVLSDPLLCCEVRPRNAGNGGRVGEWEREKHEGVVKIKGRHVYMYTYATHTYSTQYTLDEIILGSHWSVKPLSLLQLSLCHIQHAHHPPPRLLQGGNGGVNQLALHTRRELQARLGEETVGMVRPSTGFHKRIPITCSLVPRPSTPPGFAVVLAYRNRSKTGGVEGLGTRLHCYVAGKIGEN